MHERGPSVFVSPLGTSLRGLLGPSGASFVLRLVVLTQLWTVAASVSAWRHGWPVVAVVLVALDLVLLPLALLNRPALHRWRTRAWAFSERSRWL